MNTHRRAVGSTIRLNRRIHDGSVLVTGLSITYSIRRTSDGNYWNGSTWGGSYTTVNATDAYGVAANNHNKGLYYYDLSGGATADPDVLEWCSVYNDGSFDYVESGEIVLISDADIPTEVHDMRQALCGKVDHDAATGVERIYDTDGSTVLVTRTPSASGSLVTINES